jgi:endo-1,3(4)-beta-glucanase
MYFSGKGLGKFAMMLYVLHSLVSAPPDLTSKVLGKLKDAFDVFVENKQVNPLVYEKGWKGVVSTAGLRDAGADFGNGYYNDHHFHYGYFVYAAAVIGMIEPGWLSEGEGRNKKWVNMLVRDFANPVNDEGFPFSRSFDWFHGHSWAKGLFESGDGKDEESTSEDSFASYALKMWGQTIGDQNLGARGNLMLAIQARTFQTYFLMEESNTIQPEQIRRNKVTGITFENKVDHATYFGMNVEYIQGIHMIPLNPCSALIRNPTFGMYSFSSLSHPCGICFADSEQSKKNGMYTLAMAELIKLVVVGEVLCMPTLLLLIRGLHIDSSRSRILTMGGWMVERVGRGI